MNFLQIGNISQVRGVTGRSRAGTLESRSLQRGRDNTQKIHAETTLPPPCSILPANHVLPAACDAQRTQRAAAAGTEGNPHWGHRESLVGTVVPLQLLPRPKGSGCPLPTCWSSQWEWEGRTSAASRTGQGSSAAERNRSALQLPREEKNQQLASSCGVWHSVWHKQTKNTTKKSPSVGFFWEGEWVFVLKGVICVFS